MLIDPAPPAVPETASDLAERYETIAYAAQSHPQTHPAHLATIATLLSRTPPPVATCRVLEVGCGDGANLIPMAALLPHARFTGCDLSGNAIASAARAVADLGLANVTLLQQDLATLVDRDDRFDYIIAHGVFSWVPAPVREALLALAARRLTTHGVMIVSFNTFPGCHVRQAAWEILHAHVDALPTARERIDAARALAGMLAEPGITQSETDGPLRAEFARLARESDSALYHDDLGVPNQPFYFREFATGLARHGLAFLGEAKLSMMTTAGLSPRMAQLVAGMDLLTREQYLDYARLRRLRHSLVCRAEIPANSATLDTRMAPMHASAAIALVRAAAEGKAIPGDPASPDADARATYALLQWLVAEAPRSVSMAEVTARHAQHSPSGARSAAALLFDACHAGVVDLSIQPPPLAARPSAKPQTSAYIRWQASRQASVTNLRHETLRIDDPVARRLLVALDGTHTRDQLAASIASMLPGAERASAAERVTMYLSHFALHALLQA